MHSVLRSSYSNETGVRVSLRLLLKRDIVLVVASKAINGTTTLALNLYAVHYLPPAEFGALTLCTTLLVLLDGMVGSALDLAVVKLRPLEKLTANGSPVERAAIGLKTIGCLIFGSILTIFAPQLGMLFLHRGDARSLFFAWSVAATAILTMRSTQLALQLRERYRSFACVELLNTGLRIGLVVWALHHGHRSGLSIITCFAIASCAAMCVGLATLIKISGILKWWALDGAGLVLKSAGNALATYGVSALVSRMDVLVLAVMAPPVELGLYGSAMTLATIPEIAATYLAPAFLPRIEPYCRQGVFGRFFIRLHVLLYALMALAYAALLWIIPRFGGDILPAKYAPALAVTLVLLPGTLATASIFPLSLNLLMLKGSRIFLYFDLFAAPLLVVVYNFSSKRGILTVAAVTAVVRVSKTVFVQWFAARAAAAAQSEWQGQQDQDKETSWAPTL